MAQPRSAILQQESSSQFLLLSGALVGLVEGHAKHNAANRATPTA